MNNEIEQFLLKIKPVDTLFVGIGNTLKGDDGAGPILSEMIKMIPGSHEVLDAGMVPENNIGKIKSFGRKSVVFLDALDFKADPGGVRVFSVDEIYDGNVATHSFSIGFICDLIREELDCNFYMIGIQPSQMRMGEGLSSKVKEALERITHSIAAWVVEGDKTL